MKSNIRKRKQSYIGQKPFISISLVVLFFIVIMFLDNYPSLQPLRDNWIYIITNKVAISGVILYFTWVWAKKPPLLEKITISIFALLPWITLFSKSYRFILFIEMILFYILLCSFIKQFLTYKKYSIVTNAVTIILAMFIVFSARDYTFLHNSGEIHFWEIALIASFLVTVVYTVLLIKNIIHLEDNRISERIVAPFLVFGATFIFVSFTICNLNYSLDSSKPIDYRVTILEKHIDSGSRSPSDYIFSTNVNGKEKEFSVSQSEYFNKDVGDAFSAQLYKGAFGHEYYIYKK